MVKLYFYRSLFVNYLKPGYIIKHIKESSHQMALAWLPFFLLYTYKTFLASFSNPLYFFRQIQITTRNIIISKITILAEMLQSSLLP